jgi:hypothetical protein
MESVDETRVTVDFFWPDDLSRFLVLASRPWSRQAFARLKSCLESRRCSISKLVSVPRPFQTLILTPQNLSFGGGVFAGPVILCD